MSKKNPNTKVVRVEVEGEKVYALSWNRDVRVPADWDEEQIEEAVRDYEASNGLRWDNDGEDIEDERVTSVTVGDETTEKPDLTLGVEGEDPSECLPVAVWPPLALQVFVRGFGTEEAGNKLVAALKEMGFTVGDCFTPDGLIETHPAPVDNLEPSRPDSILEALRKEVPGIRVQYRYWQNADEGEAEGGEETLRVD